MKITPPYALPGRAYAVYRYMKKTGSISARDAFVDLDMTSATLARRICDLEVQGYSILRSHKTHPVTGRRYTRYSLVGA
jgi:predicted ArsR family transcriptional regulator